MRWTNSDLHYTLKDVAAVGLLDSQVFGILDGLVAACAFHDNVESLGFSPSPDQVTVLEGLENHGIVQRCGAVDRRWFLTQDGVRRVVSCRRLIRPSCVFQLRRDIPLLDLSGFELAVALRERGWEWNRWQPPSARSRRNVDLFVAYRRDGVMRWFSTKDPCMVYMAVLLDAERLSRTPGGRIRLSH